MKTTINTIIIFSFFSIFAQDRYSEIKYYFQINNGPKPAIINCALLHNANSQSSTFINFGFDIVPEDTKTENSEIDGSTSVDIHTYETDNSQKPEWQKFFLKDTLMTHESIYGEKDYYIVVEKIPLLKWEILNDTLTILNFKTQKAKVNFRGRDYFAWFATDIKISDGPYKFHGLPGLILKIQSVNELYTFEAYSIKLNTIKENFSIADLKDKYPRKKIVSIKEKISLMNKNIEKEKKYRLSNDPGVTDIKIEVGGIELNFDDVINEK